MIRHREINERGIGMDILEAYYIKQWSVPKIAKDYGVPVNSVNLYIREDKLRNYNDNNIENISMVEEYSPLDVIKNYFLSVQHAAKEMGFTAMTAQMLREEVARIISEEGITAITKGAENSAVFSQWLTISNKMLKLQDGAKNQLETYIKLFQEVLDVQKELSYVKVITEILSEEDPVLYQKIQRALARDPHAKQVLDALTRQDVISYWDAPQELEEIEYE